MKQARGFYDRGRDDERDWKMEHDEMCSSDELDDVAEHAYELDEGLIAGELFVPLLFG